MRIGFLSPEYAIDGQVAGGLANYLNRLCTMLVDIGHDVHVFYSAASTRTTQNVSGVHFHSIRSQRPNLDYAINRITASKLSATLRIITTSYNTAQAVRCLHRATPFDILQSANYKSLGLLIPYLTNIPMVVRASSYRPLWNRYNENPRSLDQRLVERLEDVQYRRAHGVFAPSRYLAEVLKKEVGLRRVAVLRTPFYPEVEVWDDSWRQEHLAGREYLLFFGALVARKGAHVLAQALPTVWRRFPKITAVFIGQDKRRPNGQMMRDYIQQVCHLGAERLVFCQELAHSQLFPVIDRARVVVLPSLVDNLPNTQLEAMGLGKTVIGTYGSSLDEIIKDGDTGFLTPPGDPEILAAKIISVWESPDLDEIGQRAKIALIPLAPKPTIRQLLGYYESILSK